MTRKAKSRSCTKMSTGSGRVLPISKRGSRRWKGGSVVQLIYLNEAQAHPRAARRQSRRPPAQASPRWRASARQSRPTLVRCAIWRPCSAKPTRWCCGGSSSSWHCCWTRPRSCSCWPLQGRARYDRRPRQVHPSNRTPRPPAVVSGMGHKRSFTHRNTRRFCATVTSGLARACIQGVRR
jgi:hypothetical protein